MGAGQQTPFAQRPSAIPALVPRGAGGHQFVCYADCCSGVPGAPHERTFAAVNAVVARLVPQPEFIVFPGDEIIGLTADEGALRAQWRHWHEREMAWLNRADVPLYHATGNHTTYDAMSEAVFRDALPYLPRNGPPGQEGLSYFVRRGDLLLVVVNTCWSGFGAEGQVETAWLDRTLADQADARYKLVVGHHPVYPVNGFAGAYQRELTPAQGRAFWRVLVRHGVLAYLCSHLLAFDAQVHDGVLQILTAGAGTAHRMPPESEYLHAMQLALDPAGLRYQVLDDAGLLREWLSWPPTLPPSDTWLPTTAAGGPASPAGWAAAPGRAGLLAWRFSGVCAAGDDGAAQTLVSGWRGGGQLAHLWVGLVGREPFLAVQLSPAPGRSPHLWRGPALIPGEPFDVQLALHNGMGPGGIITRAADASPWSSLIAASPWGAERLAWPERWGLGHGQGGPADWPFRGRELRVAAQVAAQHLEREQGRLPE